MHRSRKRGLVTGLHCPRYDAHVEAAKPGLVVAPARWFMVAGPARRMASKN
jgi:hypothetical protein